MSESETKAFLKRCALSWKARQRRVGVDPLWCYADVVEDFRAQAREAQALGLVDEVLSSALDALERRFARIIDDAVDGELVPAAVVLGTEVAENVFGAKDYANRLDKQLAVCASAVGEVAIEQAIMIMAADATSRFLDWSRS